MGHMGKPELGMGGLVFFIDIHNEGAVFQLCPSRRVFLASSAPSISSGGVCMCFERLKFVVVVVEFSGSLLK